MKTAPKPFDFEALALSLVEAAAATRALAKALAAPLADDGYNPNQAFVRVPEARSNFTYKHNLAAIGRALGLARSVVAPYGPYLGDDELDLHEWRARAKKLNLKTLRASDITTYKQVLIAMAAGNLQVREENGLPWGNPLRSEAKSADFLGMKSETLARAGIPHVMLATGRRAYLWPDLEDAQTRILEAQAAKSAKSTKPT